MKKKFFLFICFFIKTNVIRQIPIKDNQKKFTQQSQTESSIQDLIFNQNNEVVTDEKIDSGLFFLNLRIDGLFFSSNHQIIQPKVKNKFKKHIAYFYKKNAIHIKQLFPKKTISNKKLKKITFHKKNTHKHLIYNLHLSFDLFNLEINEEKRKKWKKIHNLIKKQLFLYYLDKKLRQNLVFSYSFDIKQISSKKNFNIWLQKTINSSHFEQILKQAKKK